MKLAVPSTGECFGTADGWQAKENGDPLEPSAGEYYAPPRQFPAIEGFLPCRAARNRPWRCPPSAAQEFRKAAGAAAWLPFARRRSRGRGPSIPSEPAACPSHTLFGMMRWLYRDFRSIHAPSRPYSKTERKQDSLPGRALDA